MTSKEILKSIKEMGLSANDLDQFQLDNKSIDYGFDENYSYDDLFAVFGPIVEYTREVEQEDDLAYFARIILKFNDHDVFLRIAALYYMGEPEWSELLEEVFPQEVKIIKFENPQETVERLKAYSQKL